MSLTVIGSPELTVRGSLEHRMSSPAPPPFTSALIAGGIAGTSVDVSLYPIDTLKTRLQSSAGFQSSGGFRGIYRGLGSAVVGSAPSAALFFLSYESVKSLFARKRELDAKYDRLGGELSLGDWSAPLEHMGAASVGELAACAVRVPTEVIKQRAQASQAASSRLALQDVLDRRKVIGMRGMVGELYRGLGVTVMREIPFTIIQFPLWEALKEWRRRTTGMQTSSAVESAFFGSVAGAAAAGFTTPLDVVKTRIMLAKEREAMLPMLSQILKQSGPRALFAGIGPRILWISTGGAIFLGSYQFALNQLNPQS